jgi:hypothetical protein
MLNKKVLMVFLVLLIMQSVKAEIIVKPELQEELYSGEIYKNLFRIENTDYVKGQKSCIDASVYYSFNHEGLFYEDSFDVKCLNKYKTSGTGSFNPEKPGNYTLCFHIINSTEEYNKNDKCVEIFVEKSGKSSFNISLKMNVLGGENKKNINEKSTVKSIQGTKDSTSKTPTGSAVYESSSLKSVKVSTYLFMGLLIVVIVLLLSKK